MIQAHVHNYQRTYPISYNNNDPSNPTITSTNPNDYKDPKGPIFVIVGTAGKSHAMFEGTKTLVYRKSTGYRLRISFYAS